MTMYNVTFVMRTSVVITTVETESTDEEEVIGAAAAIIHQDDGIDVAQAQEIQINDEAV